MKPLELKPGRSPTPPRCGVTLVEIAAASLLLTVLATLLTQGLLALRAEHGEAHLRQIARYEVANELQRLAALPWNELVTVPSGPSALSAAAKDRLPGARMTIAIETPADAEVRRIHVELQWLGPTTGQPEQPIRLTTWVYRQARKESP